MADFLVGERRVNGLHRVAHFALFLPELLFAGVVGFPDDVGHAALAQQRNGGLEGDEFAQLGHVDAIAVRIADLRRGGAHDDALRIRAREDAQQAFLQRGAADDGVIDDDEIVLRSDDTVRDVVAAGDERVTPGLLRDEGAHLDVLQRDFLRAGPVSQHEIVELFLVLRVKVAVLEHFEQRFLHGVAPRFAQAVQKAEVGRLRRVRDETEHRVLEIVVDRLHHLRHELFAKRLALFVDGGVVAAAEVDALKRAGHERTHRRELLQARTAIRLDHHDVGRGQFVDFRLIHAKDRHQGHALAGDDEDLVVLVVVARADAAGVAHHKEVSIANHADDGIAAVPVFRGGFDDLRHIELAADHGRDVHALHAAVADGVIELRVRLIELEADLLQHALRVRAEDGVLPALHHELIELVRVREVEVPHDHERAGRPGAAAHIGMQRAFAKVTRGAVAQVADVNLASHLELALDGHRIVLKGHIFAALLVALLLALPVHAAGDALVVLPQFLKGLTDTLHALRAALAEHVGQPRGHIQLAAADAKAVLAAVALLLHQRLQRIEAIQRVAILRMIIAERLFKPHDSYAALMPDWVAHSGRGEGSAHSWRVPAGMQEMARGFFRLTDRLGRNFWLESTYFDDGPPSIPPDLRRFSRVCLFRMLAPHPARPGRAHHRYAPASLGSSHAESAVAQRRA